MKRIAAIVATLAAAGALTVLLSGAGGGGGDYKVRAIFDSAFSVIAGEDVKIAGVKVGKIGSLDVTPDQKAAVVLDITRPGFKDFRADASCTIRPQSLIGEQFVECSPTQPRPAGAQEPPPLQKIKRGAGKGQYLLPVERTSTPVGIDLIQNVLRLPYRQRLSLILNELGAAVAGRGSDLRDVIRRANPALQETDKVLKLLASQNHVLADLASESDRVLSPLARERTHVADFIVKANNVAQATAERRADFERTLQKLPAFLRQLTPTVQRLRQFADQAAPVFTDLRPAAPDISRFLEKLGPFSTAGLPAVRSLGNAADVGTPAVKALLPITRNLRTFANTAQPVSDNLSALLTSFKQTGGIESLVNFFFYGAASLNGFDSVSHFLRTELLVNTCSTYSVQPVAGCNSNFRSPSAGASSASAAVGNDPALERTARVLAGASKREVLAGSKKRAAKRRAGALQLPKTILPGDGARRAPARSTKPVVQSGGSAAPDDALLNYLLGSGG